MKNRKKLVNFAVGAIIAALYVVLTYLASAMGLSSGVIQVRFSEALTVLPVFTPAAIPGLFIGCLISNLLTGCALWDVIFGSLATLLGAIFTYILKNHKLLAVLPPIISNAIIVPPVLIFVYGVSDAYWFILLTVCIGEIISCGILGTALRKALEKSRIFERI
ncbi:MAG: QueT transporter family protein [Ruminococcaceae bacterium]|nr:QueT transporter family protein [Oscillospiraceae bacterium]